MKDVDSKTTLRLDEPARVAMVTDQRALRYLAPFLSAEHTLSSAAAAAGVSPSTMAYWLPRFCALRLVEVTARNARAGMASKRYKAVADVFEVPADKVDPDRLGAIIGAAHDAMGDLLVVNWAKLWAAGSLEISAGEPADIVNIRFQPAEDDGRRPVVFLFNDVVAMSSAQARELRDELMATVKRHKAAASGGREYLVQVAVSPTD